MKIFSKALCVAALAIAVAPLAKADTSKISFTGNDTYSSDGTITFDSGTEAQYGYGAFADFTKGVTSWISSFNYMSTATPFTLFTVASNTVDELLTFTVTSLSGVVSGDNLTISGAGTYSIYNGDTNTYTTIGGGSFNLTTQSGGGTEFVTFSDTNTITPEPSSLMLLGTGLVGAAGMLTRRRRVIA